MNARTLLLLLPVAVCACEKQDQRHGPVASLSLTSSSLSDGQPIPAANACTDYDHLGSSPPLTWKSAPSGTNSLALTMTDPDAKGFVHWAVINIPAQTTSLAEGASPSGMPAGSVELPNDFGKPGYGGPCPPPGAPHSYIIQVYALKQAVTGQKPDSSLLKALDDNALATGTLKVTHKR